MNIWVSKYKTSVGDLINILGDTINSILGSGVHVRDLTSFMHSYVDQTRPVVSQKKGTRAQPIQPTSSANN
jgi:hypothetical protein